MGGQETKEGPYQDWGAVMEDLLHGDPDKQERALRRLSRLLSRFLDRLRARDHGEEWKDLRQTVVLKLVQSFRAGQLRAPHAFVGYAYKITRNEFIDLLRARGKEVLVELPEDWGVAAEGSVDEDRVKGVRAALAKLPENLRQAVEAVYLKDQTYEKAAAATGIPLGSLKRYLRQGVAQLREQLAGGCARG